MLKKVANYFVKFNNLERALLLFLLVSQAYYFYRYIFRYGSPISPPGYQLTPAVFQYAKYVIALVFLFVLTAFVLRKFKLKQVLEKLLKQKFWFLIIAFIVYISISILKFGISPESFGISQTVKMLFVVPFVLFIPFIWKESKPFDLLKIFIVISVAYHVIYELYMLAMFFLFKQLPGLAFSRLLPRYGGGWDDPNGFGAFGGAFDCGGFVNTFSERKG